MQNSSLFLRTKLLPPRPILDLLRRPRLIKKLTETSPALVTMVAADAGYGKTTLVADFLSDQARPYIWYQLDHTDSDPIVFLNYVAQGIKNIEPKFGEALFPYLADANEEMLRFPERAADLLINEILQFVEQPFILVLDDYHHIGRDTIVHKIIDRILQYSSELLHLMITTRDLPPLAIMRRRTQAAALVITRDDLLFTDDEVKELFKKTLDVELKTDEIAEYRNRTHGWITALQLVRQVAEKELGTDAKPGFRLMEMLRRSEKDIFDYFAEEVFSREDDETKNLLLYLSLLESMPLEQCSLLFPDMRCSAVLPELAQKNVFLSVASDGGAEEYRFHPLFRDFLQRRLRSEIGQAGVHNERNRIAELFLKHKQWEIALPFFLEAENYERAAEVLAQHGNEWIATGAIVSLGTFAEKIPNEFLERHPRSLLHKAECARLQGESSKSSSLLNRAVKLFHKQKDAAGEAEALHSLASLARRRAKLAEALDLLEKAERLVPKDSETYLKCLNTRGLCLISDGKWNEAEQQFRTALELAETQSNEHYIRLVAHNLALAPGLRGDFGEALKWFNRIFLEKKSRRPLPQEAIGHLNVARLHLYRGEFDETEKHLERALELGQLFNLRALLPEIFETYANFYRERQDVAHAAEFYERARLAYDEAGVDLATRELNEERAYFYIGQGDTVKARCVLETTIESRRKLDKELFVNTAMLCICRIDLMEGKTDGLTQRIGKLLDFFHTHNHYYDEALAAMLLAETLFALDKKKEMVANILRVLDLSARFDYDYWLKKAIRSNPGIFAYEDIIEKLPPDLAEIVENGELRVESLQKVVSSLHSSLSTSPLTDLTLKILGPTEIYRDPSKPFAPDAWTTKRARDIFFYIATSKHRRVAKEVLIEAFWGDEDLETVEKNFHPTISHIRKALNSRQQLKQNFIVFRDGAYQLNPELSYFIDTEEFLAAIAHAETAKKKNDVTARCKHLTRAYELYRGDFLEGSYEDWAEEQRHFYRERFSQVLSGLAKLSLTEKKWPDALKFANEILAIDPYREDLHRLVLKVLSAQGKHTAFKKHYEDMSHLLKQELGIEPSAETKKVFKELMK